jgi:MFS transporter, ACS family, solute carrier family 17 (sodium-dependent inorganic phosphate cotransporter), member 5
MLLFFNKKRGFSRGGGYCVNVNDIGGKYSGILYGVSNTLGTVPGIIAPYIVSLMTPDVIQLGYL